MYSSELTAVTAYVPAGNCPSSNLPASSVMAFGASTSVWLWAPTVIPATGCPSWTTRPDIRASGGNVIVNGVPTTAGLASGPHLHAWPSAVSPSRPPSPRKPRILKRPALSLLVIATGRLPNVTCSRPSPFPGSGMRGGLPPPTGCPPASRTPLTGRWVWSHTNLGICAGLDKLPSGGQTVPERTPRGTRRSLTGREDHAEQSRLVRSRFGPRPRRTSRGEMG